MKQQNHTFKILLLITSIVILKTDDIAFSGESVVDPREVAVDVAIGGMKQGSHILTPKMDADINKTPKIPGSELNQNINTGSSASNVTGNQTSAGANLGTGEQIPSSETGGGGIESGNADVGGMPSVNETPSEAPSTGVSETIGHESTDTSIITFDADVSLSEDNINTDANLAIDPSAGGALIDADATASTDIVNQELTSDAGLLVNVGESTTGAEISTIGTEDGTSTAAPVGETEAGIEADVEATGSGDVVDDPADGLSPEATLP